MHLGSIVRPALLALSLAVCCADLASAAGAEFRSQFVPALERAASGLGIASISAEQRENAIALASLAQPTASIDQLAEEQALALLGAGIASSVAAPDATAATVARATPAAGCSDGKCSDGKCETHLAAAAAGCSDGKCSDAKCTCSDGKCESHLAAAGCSDGKCSDAKCTCSDGKCAVHRA
ncbi:MAG: hypothetical protein HYY25_02350 [Candidatus Wallbacteria bacterium]|nr:hypothetical protein [Candidatus Wallbacteria bacterium]